MPHRSPFIFTFFDALPFPFKRVLCDVTKYHPIENSFLIRLGKFQDTRDISNNFNMGKAQLGFELLPEGRSLGLTPLYVGQQVREAFFGALAIRQLRGTNETEVRVKLTREERKDLDNLEQFIIRAPDGTAVPLLNVVKVSEGQTQLY
jgi:multidrug efflux pump subunit AcrB